MFVEGEQQSSKNRNDCVKVHLLVDQRKRKTGKVYKYNFIIENYKEKIVQLIERENQ